MKILVDTSVWSVAFRKGPKGDADERVAKELSELIRELRVIILGPIRQELLSGISDKVKYEGLRKKLRVFDDEVLSTEHYELAASFSNECRRNGVQGSHTDFLICAVGVKDNCAIFTLDRDFERYREYIPIKLHAAREGL